MPAREPSLPLQARDELREPDRDGGWTRPRQHQRIRYEERGTAVSTEAKKVRARKMIRELRSLGYQVELVSVKLMAFA